jgi:hypothetical protein
VLRRTPATNKALNTRLDGASKKFLPPVYPIKNDHNVKRRIEIIKYKIEIDLIIILAQIPPFNSPKVETAAQVRNRIMGV